MLIWLRSSQSNFRVRCYRTPDIAAGAVGEILETLRAWRYTGPHDNLINGENRELILIGHSFGGAILYRALSQSLFGVVAGNGSLRPPADCVLLLNPALFATAYSPLHQAIRRKGFLEEGKYRFFFAAVTADDDRAVHRIFRAANTWQLFTTTTNIPAEVETLGRAIGNIDFFRTGTLELQNGSITEVVNVSSDYSGPFHIFSAGRNVIIGHGGISEPPFVEWMTGRVRDLRPSRSRLPATECNPAIPN